MSSLPLTTSAGRPISLLNEGSKESKGREVNINNFTAAKLMGEILKSGLGPRARDKMIVDTFGEVTITNDGATILQEIEIIHPVGKMMVDLAKTVDKVVGDGTASVVLLTGALIEKAEELINMGVHPTIIVDGYRKASVRSIAILDSIVEKIIPTNKNSLLKIANTSIQSKLVSGYDSYLSELIVDAAIQVAEKMGEKYRVDVNNVKVQRKEGGSISDTVLIRGIMLENEIVHALMPKRVEDAVIALLNVPLELSQNQTNFTYKYSIESPEKMEMFFDEEDKIVKEMIDKIVQTGANVVVCQKGMANSARHYLAEAGLLAVKRVKDPDMIKVSKAIGGNILTDIRDITEKDLGRAGLVEERQMGSARPLFIEDCKNPRSLTILIRGGSERVVEEAERSIHDGLMVMKDVMEKPAILGGGGAPEAYVARKLGEWAIKLSGREQLAVKKFAEALEIIPLVLAENAGMDPIDTMIELRAKQNKGAKWVGIDVRRRKLADMMDKGIIEPFLVKEQIIKSATETASMILRIDDVIAKPKSKFQPLKMKDLDIDK